MPTDPKDALRASVRAAQERYEAGDLLSPI
jgi:hypothetical protein